MNNKDKLWELIEKKLEFCPDGKCFFCGHNICEDMDLDDNVPITGCPKCHRSFVD